MSRIELICPNCGDVFSVPSHTTTAEDGEYRPCSWSCRDNDDTGRDPVAESNGGDSDE